MNNEDIETQNLKKFAMKIIDIITESANDALPGWEDLEFGVYIQGDVLKKIDGEDMGKCYGAWLGTIQPGDDACDQMLRRVFMHTPEQQEHMFNLFARMYLAKEIKSATADFINSLRDG